MDSNNQDSHRTDSDGDNSVAVVGNKPEVVSLTDGVRNVRFEIPSPPPDRIYKYRIDKANPASHQWDKGTVSFVPERFEYIEGKGCFVNWYGCKWPSKTVVPAQAIYAFLPVKRRFIDTIRLLSNKDLLIPLLLVLIFPAPRKRVLNQMLRYFNEEADLTVLGWYMEGYYCDVVREIQKFAQIVLQEIGVKEGTAKKTAELIGMMFEYDNAYRFRINDLLNETSKEALLGNFPKEVERLIRLEAARDKVNTDSTGKQRYFATNKFDQAGRLLKLAWKLPPIKRAITKGIEAMDFQNVKLSESDIFHSLNYEDYDTGGRTIEERMRMYEVMCGPDRTKWPPQILVRNKPI